MPEGHVTFHVDDLELVSSNQNDYKSPETITEPIFPKKTITADPKHRETMKPYFYVFRVGGSLPRIKHYSAETAEKEALRLAEQHPGESLKS
ncbi:MAG: hypothetical protein QM680_13470 [Luteolibacter sp.]